MLKEIINKVLSESRGPGGPQGNFNLSPGISNKEYAKAMDKYENKYLAEMAVVGTKFKAENEPHIYEIRGVANQGFQQTYYTSKRNKSGVTTIKLTSHPRSGLEMSINFGDKGTSVSSSYEVPLEDLTVDEVDEALQKIADKFPEWEKDNATWSNGTPAGKSQYFPLKFKASFNKRLK